MTRSIKSKAIRPRRKGMLSDPGWWFPIAITLLVGVPTIWAAKNWREIALFYDLWMRRR